MLCIGLHGLFRATIENMLGVNHMVAYAGSLRTLVSLICVVVIVMVGYYRLSIRDS